MQVLCQKTTKGAGISQTAILFVKDDGYKISNKTDSEESDHNKPVREKTNNLGSESE